MESTGNDATDIANKVEGLDINKEKQKHPDEITPDYVMQLTNPTDVFLCKLTDNWPKFKFRGFKIRDIISKITLVEVPDQEVDNEVSDDDDPTTRVIKYHLGPDFLKLRTVGLTLEFGIGEKPV